MLTNRPEFSLADTAAMHLGATAFSVYNTSSAEQVHHLFRNAGNRVVVTERQFLPRVLEARTPEIEHVVLVDGAEAGTITLAGLARMRVPRLRLRRRLARGGARRRRHADLHLGHHRPAEGRAAHAPQRAVPDARRRRDARTAGGRPQHLLPAERARRRPLPDALRRVAVLRQHRHLDCGPPPGRPRAGGGAADRVRRRAARLGEAQGRARSGRRHRPGEAAGAGQGRGPREARARPDRVAGHGAPRRRRSR